MDYPLTPIATLHTCYKEKFGIPRQMNIVKKAPAQLIFLPEFSREEAVRELDGFSHVWLIFLFHRAFKKKWQTMVRPPRLGGNKKVGVFASRSPFRPNPIGISAMGLESIEISGQGPILHLTGADILDRTPVLDIKPYLPYSDTIPEAQSKFAQFPPEPGLVVEFSTLAKARCREKEREIPNLTAIITGILENDPRPAYSREKPSDPERVYGIRLFDFDLKWRIRKNIIRVISLDRIK